MTELDTLKALLASQDTSATGRYSHEAYRTLTAVGDERDGFATVDREEHESRRWSRAVTLITQGPSGAYYRWGYDEGLTEMQDDERYSDDVVEVTRHEELVPVVNWKAVK